MFENLVSVPLQMTGPTHLRLQFVSGDNFDVSGSAITIELKGEYEFVETLPEDWSPDA